MVWVLHLGDWAGVSCPATSDGDPLDWGCRQQQCDGGSFLSVKSCPFFLPTARYLVGSSYVDLVLDGGCFRLFLPCLLLYVSLRCSKMPSSDGWLKCLTLLTLRTVQQLLITSRVPLFVCQLRYIGCARPQCWSSVNPHEDSSSEPSIYGIMSCQLRRSLAWVSLPLWWYYDNY